MRIKMAEALSQLQPNHPGDGVPQPAAKLRKALLLQLADVLPGVKQGGPVHIRETPPVLGIQIHAKGAGFDHRQDTLVRLPLLRVIDRHGCCVKTADHQNRVGTLHGKDILKRDHLIAQAP